MHEIPLFGAAQWLDTIAVIEKNRVWTWKDVQAASLDLANRFADDQVICNMCHAHLAFLITWLAALRRGLRQILPPSRGTTDLMSSLALHSGQTTLVTDDPSLTVQRFHHHQTLLLTPHSSKQNYQAGDLAWTCDPDAALVTLYTSGSTGKPEPKHKTLRQLITGAHILAARFKDSSGIQNDETLCLVSSVSLQHMFGIEATLMQSLVYGHRVLNQRPLLPADIQDAFETCHQQTGGNALWITTPLHMRGVSRTESRIEHCHLVVTSTMPLAVEIAARTASLTRAPVVEIYGSTETGALATRHTATQTDWTTLDAVSMSAGNNQIITSGRHFDSPQVLNDAIEQTDAGRFKLLGRHSDLIKVAGRRTSLTGLNLILQNLDGLDDGTFYLPATDNPDERVSLIYISSTLTHEQIKSYLAERIDSIFIPRALIKVEALPRTDSGKLATKSLAKIYQDWSERKDAHEYR